MYVCEVGGCTNSPFAECHEHSLCNKHFLSFFKKPAAELEKVIPVATWDPAKPGSDASEAWDFGALEDKITRKYHQTSDRETDERKVRSLNIEAEMEKRICEAFRLCGVREEYDRGMHNLRQLTRGATERSAPVSRENPFGSVTLQGVKQYKFYHDIMNKKFGDKR